MCLRPPFAFCPVADDHGGVLLHIGCDVGVGVECEARVGVTEDARKRFRVDAARQCVRCKGVAQVMKADVGETRIFQDHLQPLVCGVRRSRLLGRDQAREYPFRHRVFLPLRENMQCSLRKKYRAFAAFRFRFARDDTAAARVRNGALDFQLASVLVEVAPFQSAYLAETQSGCDLCVEEIVPHRLALNCFHEDIQLFFVQYLHRCVVVFRDLRTLCRVFEDQSRDDRCVQCFMQEHMDIADIGIRELVMLADMMLSRFTK